MESEEYMNRKQQEAEMAEVSILIIIIITGHHSKRVTTERRGEREGAVPEDSSTSKNR